MNLLCILDKLPAADVSDPEAVNKKGGLFPVALHALEAAGHHCTLVVINRQDAANERRLADRLGCRYVDQRARVRPGHWLAAARALRYRSVTLSSWPLHTRLRKALKYRRQKLRQVRGTARCLADVEQLVARGDRFDHVLAMTSYDDAGLLACELAERIGCPFSVWEHQTHYARRKLSRERIRKTRAAALRAHATCAVSPQLRDEIARTLGADVGGLTVVPNPIGDDFLVAPPTSAFAEIEGLRSDDFVFAAWTAWRDFKRLDVALRAFASVAAEVEGCRFVVAGKPRDSARRLATRLGIDDRVVFLGNVGRERIKALAYGCDCVVVPSDCETFGLPVIEALAAGKPVVATRCGGPESIVVDSRLGQIVEPGDPAALAEGMRSIMRRHDSFDAGFLRRWCAEHYGEAVFARRWEAVLAASRPNEESPEMPAPAGSGLESVGR